MNTIEEIKLIAKSTALTLLAFAVLVGIAYLILS